MELKEGRMRDLFVELNETLAVERIYIRVGNEDGQ